MQDSLESYLKLTKNSKQDEPLKISKEMVVTAQLKKECDARAMKIVEFSIEGKLRPEVFTRCLPFINQSHYQDIVEERALTKLCGYSICGKRIPEMPKKQYFISTKSNKVYDITERKNFCSNFCYKASLHIKKQIDNSPLWTRKLEDIPEYNLLQSSESGLPGELIEQGLVRLSEELKFTSVNVFAQASLGDITEREIDPGQNKNNNKTRGFKKSSRLQSTMQTIKETEVEEESTVSETIKTTRRLDHKKSSIKIIKKETHKINCILSLPSIEENEERLQSTKENDCGNEINVITKLEAEDAKLDHINQNPTVMKTDHLPTKLEGIAVKAEPLEANIKNLVKIKQGGNSKTLDVENIVRKAFEEWISLDTCIFVHGEQKVKQILTEKKLSDCFDELHIQEGQMEQQMRYLDICRRLQLQEMADEKFDKALVEGNKLKPLPDFKRLKEDIKDMKLKVRAFYGGSLYEQADTNFPTKGPTNDGDDLEGGPPAVLPPVDVNSQNLLRRKIFLNSLSKAIQQLLQSLGAPYSSVLSDVQALVKTFKLKANNITFKPLIWNYIALVLLDLLSLKDEALKELLEEPRSQEYTKVLLEGLPNKGHFVSDLLINVKDIELFVERYITGTAGQ